MVIIHVILENGDTFDIFTAGSCIDREIETARKEYGTIKSYEVEKL